MFPNHDGQRVGILVDSALKKLTKRLIRHWVVSDEFCLTYEEAVRVQGRLAELEVANVELDSEIRSILRSYVDGADDTNTLIELTRQTVNHYLSERGEAFASAITGNKMLAVGMEELHTSAEYVVKTKMEGRRDKDQAKLCQILLESARELLTEPTAVVQRHLRAKADAYTLFAFLGRTTDIQGAFSKMFSHGTIWLDTTIMLPLLAEDLIVDGQRRFSQMLGAATGAGLTLRVTPGVIEEVERHINLCTTYVTTRSEWLGSVPFLADAYMRSGRELSSFRTWVERFEGRERPEDDLSEYFEEFFAIRREGLEEEEKRATEKFRLAVQRAWHEAHAGRRRSGHASMDEMTVNRLVQHDVENFVGVVERRRQEEVSGLGYSTWWLTLDRLARQVEEDVRSELEHDAPQSPLMSADFLVNYLSLGPVRSNLAREVEGTLPVALDMDVPQDLPEDLLAEAERIRRETIGLPERIIRRRVRDSLDTAKRRRGRVMAEGIQAVLSRLQRDEGTLR